MSTTFATTARSVITVLAQHIEIADSLLDTWWDRGYSGAITDQDIAGSGLTAAQLTDAITLFENLLKLRDNQEPAVGDYGATMNRLRSDR